MNSASFSRFAVIRLIVVLLIIAAFCFISSLRFSFFFNLIPLCSISLIVLIGYSCISKHPVFKNSGTAAQSKNLKPIMVMLILLCSIAFCCNAYNCIRYGVDFAFDSNEYWSLAKSFASGHGLGGLLYRPPLYPVLVGIFILVGDQSGLAVIIVQHMLLILFVPGIYILGRKLGFKKQSALLAASLVAVNSLLLQAAGFIMTEIVFSALALASIMSLKRLYDQPSIQNSLIAAAAFAAATYCRQLLFPVLLCGVSLLAIQKGKRGAMLGMIALFAYFTALSPWSLRNFFISGSYTMSASFGVQAFTKASTFNCLDTGGTCHAKIAKPLSNVLVDLSLTGGALPAVPEDDWQVNRIPHVLIDSLETYHGFSYAGASALLGKTAIEGFMKHPVRYASGVVASFSTLLFAHRELYPDVKYLAPVKTGDGAGWMKRFVRGMVYVSGYVFLLFPFAFFFRGDRELMLFAPFCFVCLMYLATAAVQIGLTRYTIPWEPLKALCAAYVVETILAGTGRLLHRHAEKIVFDQKTEGVVTYDIPR